MLYKKQIFAFFSVLSFLFLSCTDKQTKKEIENQFEQIKITVPHEKIGEFYKLTQYLENYKLDYCNNGTEISFTVRKTVYPKIRSEIKNIRVN